MSNTTERAALEALEARWRSLAAQNHYDYRSAMLRCADDMRALLAVSSGGAGEAQPYCHDCEVGRPVEFEGIHVHSGSAVTCPRWKPSPDPRAEPPVGEPMGADEAVLVLTNLMNLLWPHNPRSVAALRVVLGILRRVSASPASTASAQQRPTREQIAGLSPGAQAESGLDSMNWSFYTLGFGRAISLVLELYPPDAPAQTGSAQATCPNCEPPVKEEEKGKWCYVCEKQSKEGYTCGGGALWICQKCVAMYS
jgi:hypothetical protein